MILLYKQNHFFLVRNIELIIPPKQDATTQTKCFKRKIQLIEDSDVTFIIIIILTTNKEIINDLIKVLFFSKSPVINPNIKNEKTPIKKEVL